MGYILQQDWFTYQDARTAVTPSMISGHCFETIMGGAAAYCRAIDAGLGSDTIDALARHTVDVGDRRVFAGVHYPSDNLSSWLTALLLMPIVCPDPKAPTWAWNAISSHSRVYQVISANTQDGSAHAPSLDLLRRIGGGEIQDVDGALAMAAGTWR